MCVVWSLNCYSSGCHSDGVTFATCRQLGQPSGQDRVQSEPSELFLWTGHCIARYVVYWQLLSVQGAIWDVDAHILFCVCMQTYVGSDSWVYLCM